MQRGDVVVLFLMDFLAHVLGLGEQIGRRRRDTAQLARDDSGEERPGCGPVGLWIERQAVVRLVPHDAVAEHEVVLRAHRRPRESRIERVKPGVEDGDPHARAVEAGVGQRPQVQLTVRHLRWAERGVAAGTAGVSYGQERDRGGAQGLRAAVPVGHGLQVAEAGIAGEHLQAGARHVGAHRVEPAAAHAYAATLRGDGRGGRVERRGGAREQPHGEDRVACPAAWQHRGQGRPLRGEGGGQREPQQRRDPQGRAHGNQAASVWPSRTPTIVDTPGSCIVTPYTASAACMVRGL